MDDRKTDSWIQTYTGKRFDPFDIEPMRDICIEDIAHALALTNRFTGHTPKPYSVAQHSVLVASLLPPELKLWGLLHDAPEAYFADISRPVKQHVNRTCSNILSSIELHLMHAVCERFGLPFAEPVRVKHADDIALANEAFSFFGGTPQYKHWHHQFHNGYRNLCRNIVPWSWHKSETRFLAEFFRLKLEANPLPPEVSNQ